MEQIPQEAIEEFLKTSFTSCKNIHSFPCLAHFLLRFIRNFKKNGRLFLPLYFIPTIILKRKLLRTQFKEIMDGTLRSCLRTILFVSAWFSLWHYLMCATKNVRMTVDSIFSLQIRRNAKKNKIFFRC